MQFSFQICHFFPKKKINNENYHVLSLLTISPLMKEKRKKIEGLVADFWQLFIQRKTLTVEILHSILYLFEEFCPLAEAIFQGVPALHLYVRLFNFVLLKRNLIL